MLDHEVVGVNLAIAVLVNVSTLDGLSVVVVNLLVKEI